MNTFKFIGYIRSSGKNPIISITNTKTGNKQLRFMVRENENNAGFVQIFGDKLYQGNITAYDEKLKQRRFIPFEDRFDNTILQNISYRSKYIVGDKVFIWKDDFMEYAVQFVNNLPRNTKYEVSGEYEISFYNGKIYNNFNIRSIKVNNEARPELKLNLDLFYNYKSIDESDKKNKFILNAFIEQYVYAKKEKNYFPLQVQFITNRFDFNNQADIEIIKKRKQDLSPKQEEGFVMAKWEGHYVRGAQLILQPLETLPKDVQFEIINAGRDIKEYMSNVIGEAEEFICLTRPNNTLNKDGAVYMSLNCTDNEFNSKIYTYENFYKEDTIDRLAENDAMENPFN